MRAIILDLRRFGSSDEQTSVALDVSRHYIWQLTNGRVHEPKFSLGWKILMLHAKMQGDT